MSATGKCHTKPKVCDLSSGVPSPYRGDQDPVAGLHAHGQPLALLVQGAGADGEDLGLVELLDARLGQEDAGRGLGLGLDALDQDAVQERHERLDGSDGGGLFLQEERRSANMSLRQAAVVAGEKCRPLSRSGSSARGQAGLSRAELREPGVAQQVGAGVLGRRAGRNQTALTIVNAGSGRGLQKAG